MNYRVDQAKDKDNPIVKTIVIIGCGASGIGAARRILEENLKQTENDARVTFNIQILEARDRIGGRITSTKLHPNLIHSNSKCYPEHNILTGDTHITEEVIASLHEKSSGVAKSPGEKGCPVLKIDERTHNEEEPMAEQNSEFIDPERNTGRSRFGSFNSVATSYNGGSTSSDSDEDSSTSDSGYDSDDGPAHGKGYATIVPHGDSQLSSLRQRGVEHSSNYIELQLGANWIHGLNEAINPLYSVVKRLGMPLFETSSDDEPGDDIVIYDRASGRLIHATHREYLSALEKYDWIKQRLEVLYNSAASNDYFLIEEAKSHKDSVASELPSLLGIFSRLEEECELYFRMKPSHVVAEGIKTSTSNECLQTFGFSEGDRSHEVRKEDGDSEKRLLGWFYDRVAIDMACPLDGVALTSYLDGESVAEFAEAILTNRPVYLPSPDESNRTSIVGMAGLMNYLFYHEYPQLACCLTTNTEVYNIDFTDEAGPIKVHTRALSGAFSGQEEVMEADYVIVTVPLSVLSYGRMSFSPGMPSHICDAIDGLEMGVMDLVWVWFPYAFWRGAGSVESERPLEDMGMDGIDISLEDLYCGSTGTKDDWNFLGITRERDPPDADAGVENGFTTFLAPPIVDRYGRRQAVLMSQVVGDFARKIEKMADEDIAQLVVEALDGIFPQPEGKSVPFPIGLAHSSWASDRWAGGSWSFHPYQSSSATTKKTFYSHSGEDRVRYASEALSEDFRGTAHGAFLSGRGAAETVISAALSTQS